MVSLCRNSYIRARGRVWKTMGGQGKEGKKRQSRAQKERQGSEKG